MQEPDSQDPRVGRVAMATWAAPSGKPPAGMAGEERPLGLSFRQGSRALWQEGSPLNFGTIKYGFC